MDTFSAIVPDTGEVVELQPAQWLMLSFAAHRRRRKNPTRTTMSVSELFSADRRDIPWRYVVYVVLDGQAPLYVGATHYDAQYRLRQHRTKKSALGKRLWNPDGLRVRMRSYESWERCSTMERGLIKRLGPVLNVR